MLANQALKAVGIGKQLRIARALRSAGYLNVDLTGTVKALVTLRKPSRGQCNSATQTVTLLQARAMAITPARERVRKSRKRRRLGLRTVQVELSEQVIDFLLAHKYELERTDNASIGQAVSAFVSDVVLEWA